MKIIDLQGITKHFGNIKALNKLTFHIEKGEFFGLLGPNGAGKTTTINILSTLLKPDQGQVFINGFNLLTESSQCKEAIGIVPQELALYNDLTALENLMFWGGMYSIPKNKAKEKALQLLKTLELNDRRNSLIKTFSGGMKRRINLAAAMIHEPQILLMDEPTIGVDPQSRNKIFEVLSGFVEKGVTIIYTTHYMDEVEKLCDRIAVIDYGEIIASGTLEELRKVTGSSETLTVYFEKPDISAFEDLKHTFGDRINLYDNRLIVSTDHGSHDLTFILEKCNQACNPVNHIQIDRASMESVFLKLTGRQLRE